MSQDASSRAPIARLLLATHLPFLVMVWGVFMGLLAVLVVAVVILSTVKLSAIDAAGSLLRWFALGYGAHLTHRVLATHIAHGRTRREFFWQTAVFQVIATFVFAMLMAIGYWLETLVYRANGWPQEISDDRLYTEASQYPVVFASYWGMLLVWTVVGAFIGAGFYRSDGGGLFTLPVALVLVLVAGGGVGFMNLPFVDLPFESASLSWPAIVALCVASGSVGLALTWGVVRDIPLRN